MSSLDHDFGIPFLPRIEFHVDRLKAAAVGSAAIGAGILIALPPAAHGSLRGSAIDVLAAIVALAGAAALVAFGLYIMMRVLLWRGPAVVIDGHGIHDRRAGPAMTPWARVHDIRVLDRHGHHIGIDTLGGLRNSGTSAPRRQSRLLSLVGLRHSEPIAIIDTFFLRSATGNRVLDFVMPLTALTPIDLSEIPVSEETLAADASFARNRVLSFLTFALIVGVAPVFATLSIAF